MNIVSPQVETKIGIKKSPRFNVGPIKTSIEELEDNRRFFLELVKPPRKKK